MILLEHLVLTKQYKQHAEMSQKRQILTSGLTSPSPMKTRNDVPQSLQQLQIQF